ncbi:MAG: type IV toxin-antitoxin system AbiEi family antitoxin [Syntrophobacter sp.]
MKLSGKELIDKAENAIRACLENVPFVKINEIRGQAEPSNLRPDLWIRLTVPYGEQDLIAEVKNNGEPRFVREAAGRLLRYRYSAPPGTYGIVVAPFISPRSAEICTEEKIGYVDLSGNCRISFGQVYIEKKEQPNLFSEKRNLRSLYSPKAERVLRVLLTNPHGCWKLQDLANEAKVSLGQVSKVKSLLGDREWIDPEHGRMRLIKPMELLAEWAANYDSRRNEIRGYYTLRKTSEVETDLAKTCAEKEIDYALTAFSGAARLAPAVRYLRASAYINFPQEDIAPLIGLKEVKSGANVTLIRPYDPGVFYGMREVNSVRIASPVQVYLDLVGVKGRGEEAAEAILEEVIRPIW